MTSLQCTPSFCDFRQNFRFAELDDRAARFYFMLRARLDAWGRIGANVSLLNADVWPLQRIPDADTRIALEHCVEVGLLELHELDTEEWIQCVEYERVESAVKAQRPESRFPDPTRSTRIQKLGDVSEETDPTDGAPAR